jgi:hypothetical protein
MNVLLTYLLFPSTDEREEILTDLVSLMTASFYPTAEFNLFVEISETTHPLIADLLKFFGVVKSFLHQS